MSEKVVIVGGGCAGFGAAYELYKQGIDFVLLEAASRYGGRVQRGVWEEKGITYSDGAYFTEPQWGTTYDYLEEFGLMDAVRELETKVYGFWNKDSVHYFTDEGNLFASLLKFRGLPPAIIPQGAKFLTSLAGAMGKIGENYDFSGLTEISKESTREWATKHGGPEVVDKLIGPMLGMMVLARSQDVSAAHPVALFKTMKGMCIVDGGLKRINDTIYEKIKDNVRLNTPVQEIVIEDDKITGVKLADGEFIAAGKVICCTDAVDALKIIPGLPQVYKDALGTCGYSKSWHYVFYLDESIVPEDFLAMFIPESANSLVTTIFDENYKFNNAPEGSGLIHTFTAGWRDDELADLSEEDRTKRVMEEIEMFFPGFSERAQLVHCCRSGRAVNLEGPGQFVAIEDLRDNHWDDVEGLYLGGEYLFLIACTEGSWATGKEAAERLISKL